MPMACQPRFTIVNVVYTVTILLNVALLNVVPLLRVLAAFKATVFLTVCHFHPSLIFAVKL